MGLGLRASKVSQKGGGVLVLGGSFGICGEVQKYEPGCLFRILRRGVFKLQTLPSTSMAFRVSQIENSLLFTTTFLECRPLMFHLGVGKYCLGFRIQGFSSCVWIPG